mgnify:FL=1
MAIFDITAPCPIFAPVAGDSDVSTLTFSRAAHIVEARAITVNSAGETVLSFVEVGAVTGHYQPQGGNYVRMIQGTVVQIDAIFYVTGNPDVQVADRCIVSGAQLEIINTQQYGADHAEISLHHVGR